MRPEGGRADIPSLFTDNIREDGSELSKVRLLSGYDRAIAEIEALDAASAHGK